LQLASLLKTAQFPLFSVQTPKQWQSYYCDSPSVQSHKSSFDQIFSKNRKDSHCFELFFLGFDLLDALEAICAEAKEEKV